MEYIEEAGIYSGDSVWLLFFYLINKIIQEKIIDWVSKIANKINVVGIMNT
jgi:hypothetical protein